MTEKTAIKTYVTIILDRSGSMESCKSATINGFNENVQVIRRTADENGMRADTFVSLVQFNDRIAFSQFAAPLEKLTEIDESTYQPNANTAMLDAIGETLARMDREVTDSDNNRYLVTVFTDGEENASKEYTWETIAKMIQSRLNTNRWTFSYIGANQDLSQVAERTAIPRQNMMSYHSDNEGTMLSMDSMSKSMVSFMDHSHIGGGSMIGFFPSDEEADTPKKPSRKVLKKKK